MASAVARVYNGGLRRPSGGPGGRAPSGELGSKAPEADKPFPFAHPTEAANLSYFLFICSILHVQAWNDFLAHNDIVISHYWHTPHLWSTCLLCGKVNPIYVSFAISKQASTTYKATPNHG